MAPFHFFITVTLAGMVVASVSSDMGRRGLKVESSLEKRDGVVDCPDSGKAAFLSDSLTEAKLFANIAAVWIEDFGVGNPVFVDYFGAGQNNYTIQHGRFTDMFTNYTTVLSCKDPNGYCPFGAVSYWNVDGIYFCPPFFDESNSAPLCSAANLDSVAIRGATLLSKVELDHFGGDSNGNCSEAQQLASKDPYSAAYNSDSYRCFAMQVYINTQC